MKISAICYKTLSDEYSKRFFKSKISPSIIYMLYFYFCIDFFFLFIFLLHVVPWITWGGSTILVQCFVCRNTLLGQCVHTANGYFDL